MDDQKAAQMAEAKARWQAARPIMAGVVIAIAVVASGVLAFAQARLNPATVEIGDRVKVRVAVADNPATRERGLSGKDGLAADEGMLFIFDEPNRHAFWMKDMKFAIDILWIQDGAVADITTDVRPSAPGEELQLYFPVVPVDHVLEVPAGFAKAHGLRTGMPVAVRVDKAGTSR
jgi:uncharacterized membrane protein (UPF0127 family)